MCIRDRYKFFMCFKVVVFGKYPCTDKLFLQDGYKFKEVFRMTVADVIYLVRRYWQTIFTILLFRCMLHNTNNTFYYIIHIGEVAFAIAVVEDLDSFTFHKFIGETEICHIGTASRTVNGKETQTC